MRRNLRDAIPGGISVGALLRLLIRHPWQCLGARWNYKSAITSSLVRGLLFCVMNAAAGPTAALAALSTEFWLRFCTAGYYGALTQAFRRVEPERAAMIGALIVLPAIGHGLELLVHWWRGTPNLFASLGASLLLTVFSTAFNLYAMRQGAFITGAGSASLGHDLRRVPALLIAFFAALVRVLRSGGTGRARVGRRRRNSKAPGMLGA